MNKHATTKFAAMGGIFEVTVVGKEIQLISEAESFILNLENLWSRFKSASEISRLNSAEGNPVLVSDETCQLIKLMIESHSKTDQIFDPTVLPLLLELGYNESKTGRGEKTELPPSAQWPGDLNGIEINHGIVKMPKGTTLDAGGIGKGFAADLLAKSLIDHGAEGVLVSASGDVVCMGESVDGQSWKIGIEDPFKPGTEFEKIQIHDGAVATSSSMKNTFKNNEHHLIDKSIGKTSALNIATATVIANSGVNAEVLTKIAFHYEPHKAIEEIEKLKGYALIVEKNGDITRSQKWTEFVL